MVRGRAGVGPKGLEVLAPLYCSDWIATNGMLRQ